MGERRPTLQKGGDSMIRSELVQKLCGDFPGLTQREVEGVVGAMFELDHRAARQRRARRAARLRRFLDPSARCPRRPKPAHRRSRRRRRQARALLQARQGNARAPQPAGSHRRIAPAASLAICSSRPDGHDRWRRRTWRNGRRWRLKIFCPDRACGFKSRRPHQFSIV